MNYNNGYIPVAASDGLGGCGAGWLIILLICLFGGFNNGNGFGWGGNNRCVPDSATATEAAALVQQDNTRGLIAGIDARQQLNQQFTAGIADGVNRIQDAQLGLRTELCQLGNNLTQQINSVQFANQQQFCQLKQEVIDNRLAIENKLNDYRMEDLKEKNCALQSQLDRQTLLCSQNAQTNQIVSAIERNGCNPCNTGCGNAYAYAGGCNPCGPSLAEQSLATLNRIAGSLVTLNQGQEQMATALANQATAIANLQTSVNRIPTTAAAA